MITLVTGSNGQLGKTIQSIVKNKSEFIFTDINSLDITKKEKIESVITSHDINCIVNCAAYTDVDGAEIEKEKADELNDNAVKNLVEISETYKLRLIHISTDYVYNGINKSAISEYEHVNPQNYYGISKLNGEKHIVNSISESIVIRTSWLYSSFGKNFVKTIIEKSKSKDLLKIVEGPVRSGYQKIAKDLITQSVIQQFLTRTLGPNEALKQSQKWLKFVNKK